MKIENRPRPHFWLSIDLRTVEVLMSLAQAHYDAVCKHAGQWTHQNPDRRNGILAMWYMLLSHPGGVKEVDATPRDLDTLLKVCELYRAMGLDPSETAMVEDFVRSVRKALQELS